MLRLVAARGVHTAATPEMRAASQSLLPPIPLYRALLRVHRRLSPEMRSLGDDYVKAEFRRHREVTNPLYIVGFCSQWKMYLDALLADSDPLNHRGRGLDPDLLEKVRARLTVFGGAAVPALRTQACIQGGV